MRKLTDDLYAKDNQDTAKAFGAKVRKLRESHNWTIEALSEATGQSPEFIDQVEKGTAAPPVAFLLRLAKALKVDPETFLRREEKALIRSLRDQALMKRTRAKGCLHGNGFPMPAAFNMASSGPRPAQQSAFHFFRNLFQKMSWTTSPSVVP